VTDRIETAEQAIEAALEAWERILRDELAGGPRHFAVLAVIDEVVALRACLAPPPVSAAPAQPDGASLIAAERVRQIIEGWTPERDDDHGDGELAKAAACYALEHTAHNDMTAMWPWGEEAWKPHSPLRDLVRAGALIAAEIDRLQRLRPFPAADAALAERSAK